MSKSPIEHALAVVAETRAAAADTPSVAVTKKPKRVRPPSRPKRWTDATGRCLAAIATIREAAAELESAAGELRSVQEEYEEWKDNLPENLQQSPLGEKLEAVCELDIESQAEAIVSAVDEAEGVFEEADGIDLPRGFGKD